MKRFVHFLAILLCLVLVATGTPTVMAAAEQREIADFFTYDLFSDATINRLFTLFPKMYDSFIPAAEKVMEDQSCTIPVETKGSGVNISFDYTTYFNGNGDTVTLNEFLSSCGIYLYPDALGGYLTEKGYSEIGAAVSAAGHDWTSFADGDAYSFAFDWGVDDKSTFEGKYDRFIAVTGDLLDACRPVFFFRAGRYRADAYL